MPPGVRGIRCGERRRAAPPARAPTAAPQPPVARRGVRGTPVHAGRPAHGPAHGPAPPAPLRLRAAPVYFIKWRGRERTNRDARASTMRLAVAF